MPNKDQETFLATMRKRFAQAQADEFTIRQAAEEDLRYVAGEQWDQRDIDARENQKRPCLTFNRLPTFVQQVTNESRQNKPSIKFSPVDSKGDPDTAKVYEGHARHIQYASKAQVAYDTAIEYSASCSFGFFRLTTEYATPRGFEQDVKFIAVDDPFSVYGVLMPKCFGRKPQWAFVVETLTDGEYESTYGEKPARGFEDSSDGWAQEGFVRVAEYWYTEFKKETITAEVQRADGTIETKTRVVSTPIIKFCKTNGYEILEDTETTWPGYCIPIFVALGRKLILRGKPMLFSLVRFQRDPQRMLNFYKTAIAERIGLLNRAPYLGYTGQFTDPKWANANAANYAYLEAEPLILPNGQLAPLPIRQNLEGQINDLSLAASQEIEDLKAIAGIYDASMGNRSNETSGVAIAQRQRQSSITNLHFIDNLNRAQEEAGEALAEIIPHVYDTPRSIRIVGEDEEERVVRVNETYVDEETGEQKTYMLEAGKYDVKVNIGPSYTTKRQEAAAAYEAVIKAAPQLLTVLGDIYFRNGDMAGNDEASERMKKFIGLTNPGLIDEEKKQQDPQVLMQKLQQMQQMVQQLSGVAEEQADVISTKRMELESRERIEMEKIQSEREERAAKYQLETAKLGHTESVVELKHSIDWIKSQIQLEEQRVQADTEASFRQAEMDQAAAGPAG